MLTGVSAEAGVSGVVGVSGVSAEAGASGVVGVSGVSAEAGVGKYAYQGANGGMRDSGFRVQR